MNDENPSPPPFRTSLTVRIGDINYGRHLANDALLGLLHEARLRFLAAHGFSETDCGGVGLILVEAHLAFKAQAFHGDELTIEVSVGERRRTGFDLRYRVTRAGDGREIAAATTAMAFFDYARNRVARRPEAFAHAFPETPDAAAGA